MRCHAGGKFWLAGTDPTHQGGTCCCFAPPARSACFCGVPRDHRPSAPMPNNTGVQDVFDFWPEPAAAPVKVPEV